MSSCATSSSSSSSKKSTSSGTRQSITKNFEAAFGRLSSSYGFGSSSRASSSVPQKPFKAPQTSVAPASTTSTPSLSRSSSSVALSEKEKDMDGASLTEPSSNVFVVDLTRRSAPKTPAPRVSVPKDYEAAFGALSSSYGFAGGVPSLKSTCSTKAPKAPKVPKAPKKQQQQQQQPESAHRTATPAPTKDYEAAYGALVSQGGWGSSAMPSNASQGVRFTIA